MLKTSIGRLRLVGMIEGASLIALLGIAMPLKYLAGMPRAVSIIGMLHGILFLVYCVVLLATSADREWPITKLGAGFIASIIPFGPFIFDRRLREEETAMSAIEAE